MSTHEEFPKLTPEARAAAVISLGYSIDRVDSVEVHRRYRRQLAAFLREAMKQAHAANSDSMWRAWGGLEAIAASLHSPPPSPPTLADAREAARQLAGPSAEIVHAFLSTLGGAGQT